MALSLLLLPDKGQDTRSHHYSSRPLHGQISIHHGTDSVQQNISDSVYKDNKKTPLTEAVERRRQLQSTKDCLQSSLAPSYHRASVSPRS